MPRYRRSWVPGGTFFFTVVTESRAPFLCEAKARALLRQALQDCRQRWPFAIDAMVLLPDHLHAIWTLPPTDSAYPRRWGWLKKEFTKAWLAGGGPEQPRSASRRRQRRRGVWQRRYWEHTIRDEQDFEDHFHYVHYNPVKHGLVAAPKDWPYSSFHRWVREGVYDDAWGANLSTPMSFPGLDATAMELMPEATEATQAPACQP
jgi:putative transposase